MLQPNMSMAVIIGMMGIVMLYVGGASVKHIAILMFCGIVLFVLFAVIEPYRFARLTSFTDPWKDPADTGYQLIQSLYALGSGGLFGQGLNNSRQKLLYLTYGESDFVFSIVGEELGFIGAACVILLYLFIVYRGIRDALRCWEVTAACVPPYQHCIRAAVAVNIGVVCWRMAQTGQACPFLARGELHVIFLSAMGVLLNISR
jgi:cell division protein FtsW